MCTVNMRVIIRYIIDKMQAKKSFRPSMSFRYSLPSPSFLFSSVRSNTVRSAGRAS